MHTDNDRKELLREFGRSRRASARRRSGTSEWIRMAPKARPSKGKARVAQYEELLEWDAEHGRGRWKPIGVYRRRQGSGAISKRRRDPTPR